MRDDSGPDRKKNAGKPSSGFNLFLYILVAGVAIMFAAVYFLNATKVEITYDDLTRLIEETRITNKEESRTKNKVPATSATPGQAAIADDSSDDSSSESSEGEDSPSEPSIDKGGSQVVSDNETRSGEIKVSNEKQEVFYSKPTEVVIGEHSITGKVTRRIVTPKVAADKKTQQVAFRTHRLEGDTATQEIKDALTEANISWKFAQPPGIWSSYAPIFIMTGLFVLLFVLMLRRLGGAGSPMAFGRSRGRLYAQEDLDISFSDVAGINEAVEEVKEVVDFLKSPERYQRLGGRIPKGVLLVGPPGTGKTLLAKAIAGEAGVPFFSLSGSDFVEMFVGVGAARVRDMFEQAVAKAPCIIFIDELDALGKSRGTSVVGGHDEREQTLNALLVEMDGFDSNSGVIVMAATNRPEMLDQALLRPGRFDRQVLVDQPDVRGREDILKVHVKNVKLEGEVDLKSVAAISPGFVGADLANLVNEAALLAARNNKSAVGMEEFNEGVERVTTGLEKKQRVMSELEKQRVAYHEAGHALVACVLPNTDPVHKVSIIPRGLAALGYTLQRPDGDRYLMTQAELESRIQVLLAGTVAEEMVYEDISTGAQNDLERATEIARAMVMDYGMSALGRIAYRESQRSPFLNSMNEERVHTHSEQTAREIDQEVKRILDDLLEQVREILRTRNKVLVGLAEELIEVESVDAERLKSILDENTEGPQVVPGTEGSAKRASGEAPAEATDGVESAQ